MIIIRKERKEEDFLFKKGKYRLPLWLRRFRDACFQFLVPLTVFQLVRTILFPSAIDVILLTILVLMYLSYVVGFF